MYLLYFFRILSIQFFNRNKKFGIILLFLIILPDVYSWDIFFEVYEILIDLVTVLHQVRKIRKRSFSYLRRKIKNLFSFEETEELTN